MTDQLLDEPHNGKGHNGIDDARRLITELSISQAPLEQIKNLLQFSNSTLQKAFNVPGTKVITLDLDGTLYDTDAAQKNGWIIAAKQLKLPVSEADYLKLAVTVYDSNEVIEKGLFHPHINVRKIWNSDIHYAAMMFLGNKARGGGNADLAIEEFKKALSGDDPESKRYQNELDHFLMTATKKGAANELIKQAQAEFTKYCKTSVKTFAGVHESIHLLEKLGFVVVIATDGDRATQTEKVYSWLKLGRFFQSSHILCTSDAPPQEEMEYLRAESARLKEKAKQMSDIRVQLENVKNDLLRQRSRKLEIEQIDSLPTYRRLGKQAASTERDLKYTEFLRERLTRLTTKQRMDFYMTVVQAIASSPDNPLAGMGKPGLGHGRPVKVCAVGDSRYDVGIHALDRNIIVVGVLTGKPKYRLQVEKELDPSNPKLQNPDRAKKAESLLTAMPFIANPRSWINVEPIHNIAHSAAPVVSDADTRQAIEVIHQAKSSLARRIAARIVLDGSPFIKETTDQNAKEILLQRFRSATNPAEQAYLAQVLGAVALGNLEKKRFADVLTERLKHLGPMGARASLQALVYIGDKDHLPVVKTIKAESRYGIVVEAATLAEAALQRNLLKSLEAEQKVAKIIGSMSDLTTLCRLQVGIGEIKALKEVYGIRLRAEQIAQIKVTYRRVKSLA